MSSIDDAIEERKTADETKAVGDFPVSASNAPAARIDAVLLGLQPRLSSPATYAPHSPLTLGPLRVASRRSSQTNIMANVDGRSSVASALENRVGARSINARRSHPLTDGEASDSFRAGRMSNLGGEAFGGGSGRYTHLGSEPFGGIESSSRFSSLANEYLSGGHGSGGGGSGRFSGALGNEPLSAGGGSLSGTAGRHLRGAVQFVGDSANDDSGSSSGGSVRDSKHGLLELPALPSCNAGSVSSGGAGAAGRGSGAAGPAGLTFAFLESLRSASKPGATLRDFFRSTVLPATRSARCAYVNLVSSEHRARPTHVLVCSWDEPVSDVVEQVADYAASFGPQGAAGAGSGAGGGGGGGGSFAVWLDLFAVNFHAAPPPMVAPTAAAASAALGSAAWLGAGNKSCTPPMDPSTQERARALPAAIAATRTVLLLAGTHGSVLREHPCTLAVWHALRGRGGAGGAALAVVAPPELDVGLVQAAFESLSVSTKAAEDPGSSSAAASAGGDLGGGGGPDGGTRMSSDRFTTRALRDGVAAAATAAVTFAADPQPSRTVREGLTTAMVAAANALLARPVSYGAVSAGMSPRPPPSLSLQQQQSSRSCGGGMSDAGQPPAAFQSAPSQGSSYSGSASRWVPTMPAAPSPLRSSFGPSNRALVLAGVDSWPTAQSPSGSTAGGTTTAVSSPSAAVHASSISVPGEDDVVVAATTSIRNMSVTGGSLWGAASYDGGADGFGAKRSVRNLAPLTEAAAAAAPDGANGVPPPSRQQQLRIRAPAPWESTAPLPSPGRAPSAPLTAAAINSPLSQPQSASAATASATAAAGGGEDEHAASPAAATAPSSLLNTSPWLTERAAVTQPQLALPPLTGTGAASAPLPTLHLPDVAPPTPQPQPPAEAAPQRHRRGPARPHALRAPRGSGGGHEASRGGGGAANAGEDADSETSDVDSEGPATFLGASVTSISALQQHQHLHTQRRSSFSNGFTDNPDGGRVSGGGVVEMSYRRLSPDLARLVGAAKLLAALGQNAIAMRLAQHAVAASRSLYGGMHPDTARCTTALVSLMLHVQQQQQQAAANAAGHHHHGHALPLPHSQHSPFLIASPFASAPSRVGGGSSGSGVLPSVAAAAASGGGGGSRDSSGSLPLLPASTSVKMASAASADAAAAASTPTSPGSDDPEGLMRGALAVLERHLGPEHEEVAAARVGLAAVLTSAGRHEEAATLLQRVVSSRGVTAAASSSSSSQQQQHSGPRVPFCPVALAAALDLATLLAATGRERAARKLLKAQLQRLQEEEDDAAAVAAAAAIATVRGRNSSHPMIAAAAAAAAAASAAPASPSCRGFATMSSMHQPHQSHQHNINFASMKGTESPYGNASSSYSPYMGAMSPAVGSPTVGSPSMSLSVPAGLLGSRSLNSLKLVELQARAALQLAQLKAAAGKVGSAKTLYRRAIEGFSTVYGARHPTTAACMLGLAAVHHSLKEYGDARPLYRAVLDLYLELHGPHHPATTRVSNQLGDVEEAMEEEACAEEGEA